jgi:hypothetical protein
MITKMPANHFVLLYLGIDYFGRKDEAIQLLNNTHNYNEGIIVESRM